MRIDPEQWIQTQSQPGEDDEGAASVVIANNGVKEARADPSSGLPGDAREGRDHLNPGSV